jgi:hypothetical protein
MDVNPYSAPESSVDDQAAVKAGLVLPGIAKAMAIIAICLGSFNILGGLCGVVGMSAAAFIFQTAMFQQQMEKDDSAEGMQMRREISDLQASLPVYLGQLASTTLISIFLVLGGIGTLKQKEWGRKSLVFSCVAYVLVTLATWVYSASNMISGVRQMDSTQQAATVGGLVFGIFFGLIFLAYYLFTAVYFSMASNRVFFAKSG